MIRHITAENVDLTNMKYNRNLKFVSLNAPKLSIESVDALLELPNFMLAYGCCKNRRISQ